MDKNQSKNKNQGRAAAAARRLREYLAVYLEPRTQGELLSRGRRLLRAGGQALLACLLSRAALPFGTMPFGAAMLCAADRYTPAVYIGLAISSIFSPSPLAFFLMYTLGLVLRISVRLGTADETPAFAEGLGLRVLCGVAMAFMIGVCRTVAGGFLYYDLFGCALGLVCTPAAVLAFRLALDRTQRGSSLRELGLLCLCAAAIWSGADLTLLGFGAARVAAFVITLYVSRECGMLRGAVAGLFCGLAAEVALAPMFAAAGLLAGLFWRLSTTAASAVALAAGVFYSVTAGGAGALAQTAPDLLAATLIFAPLARFGLLPRLPLYAGAARGAGSAGRAELTRRSHEGALCRLEAMQTAFGELAEVFGRLAERVGLPDRTEISEMTQTCFDSYCESCARHSLCWDSNGIDTADALAALAKRLWSEGRVSIGDLAEHTARRCFRAGQIIDRLNAEYSARIERMLRENKSTVIADDYRAMAELLGQAVRDNAEEFEPDERLTRRLCAAASCLDLPLSGIAAYGRRKKSIVAAGVELARVRAGAEDIRRSFERVCGFPLCPPEFSIERGQVSMTLSSRPSFRAAAARAMAAKQGQELCGDSVSFFENGGDYFYALLSDGMGSGREAALTSRLCALFLSKMLSAGNSKACSLRMLNDAVRNKGLECFATVDLLEIDLYSGQACFVKSEIGRAHV